MTNTVGGIYTDGSMKSFLNIMASIQNIRPLAGGLTAIVLGLGVATAATPVEVAVSAARPQAVATGFEFDGVVEPVKQSTISAQTTGRIATLLVKAGDKVRAGQLLATIDDRETQTGVARSQAQVAQADAELRNASAHVARLRELQKKGFVSQAALDTAESQFKGAQAGKAQASAGAQQTALAQGYTRVLAPYDGWVLQTLAEAGDLAVPGKPILALYAPLPLRVVVQVPASRGAEARAATRIDMQAPGAGTWAALDVRTVMPAADPVSQTIEWRLEVPSSESKTLVPGQQVRIRFVGAQAQRVVVPQQAVLRRGELTAVYVATPTAFVLRAVRLGPDHGTAGVEVLAGLGPDDRVALDPVRAGLTGAKPSVTSSAAPVSPAASAASGVKR